jgi:hypothetical protein
MKGCPACESLSGICPLHGCSLRRKRDDDVTMRKLDATPLGAFQRMGEILVELRAVHALLEDVLSGRALFVVRR